MKKPATIALAALLLPLAHAMADKNKGKEQLPFMPQPDALPSLPAQDRKLPKIIEAQLHRTVKASTTYGIDVSHYQNNIDWQMAAIDQNVRFAYIKATESSGLVDSHYARNIREARRYGIPAGSYHFFSPSASSMTQLKNFMDNVDPKQQDLIPIVDVEHRGKSSHRDFLGKLKNFLLEVEKVYGVKPIIYTGVNFFNKYLAGEFSDYRFMIARYHVDEPPTLDEDVPIILWQFTSEGSVAGIRGKVDRSCFVNGYSLSDILMPRKGKK